MQLRRSGVPRSRSRTRHRLPLLRPRRQCATRAAAASVAVGDTSAKQPAHRLRLLQLAQLPEECRQCTLGFLTLGCVSALHIVDRGAHDSLKGSSSTVRVAVEPAVEGSASRSRGSSGGFLVGPRYGSELSGDDTSEKAFWSQGWSPDTINARVAIVKDIYDSVCSELWTGSGEPLLAKLREVLGSLAWLCREIRLQRLTWLQVPSLQAEGWEAPMRAMLQNLPVATGGLCLGLANYEGMDPSGSWDGSAVARTTGLWSWTLEAHQQFAVDLIAQSSIELQEEKSGLLFPDAAVRRAWLGALPALDGLFQKRLFAEDLFHISNEGCLGLRRLGCFEIRAWSDVMYRVPCFPHLEYLSLHVKDFCAGSRAWPVFITPQGQRLRHAGPGALAAMLARTFPALRRAHVYFSFDDCTLEAPRSDLSYMMEAFLEAWFVKLSRRLEVSLHVRLCGLHFDSLDAVKVLCGGERRGDAAYLYLGSLREALEGIRFRDFLRSSRGAEEPADELEARAMLLHRRGLQEQAARDREAVPHICTALSSLLGQEHADLLVSQILRGASIAPHRSDVPLSDL